MFEIFDKIIIFISCFLFYLFTLKDTYAIVPLIIVITLSCISTYIENTKVDLGITLLFAILCCFYPNFLYYLPLIIYDIMIEDNFKYGTIFLIPFYIHMDKLDVPVLSFLGLFILLSALAKYKTTEITKLSREYYLLRDTSKEFEILLQEKNKSLIENQDYEINVATLNERNRIAKEIHDNIGHILSRSLIQIGALLTITKEALTKEGLTSLKDSISEGMDSIRNSIHNIHDESVDLYTNINTLVKDFSFCPVILDYNINTPPPLKLKYCFIAIVKEALANIMKHSNATKVTIVLMEHPIMYQLIISDNGSIDSYTSELIQNLSNMPSEGMGIQNIIERVRGFEGIINITTENGFQIFITIPKK